MKPSAIRARTAVAIVAIGSALFAVVPEAHAAIVPTVLLATAADYSVLAGQTVTNTNASILNQSLGVHPGSAVVGFPPGLVNAPGTIHAADAVALQAKSDLTTAYVDAAARPVDQTGPADLTGLNLQAGVYAASSKGALLLTGNVILDGAGDPNSVFIFQTDSTLITGSGSTVSLINGVQQCNIFWQVGSSATLGTGSDFVGNILASASISVENSVTVHGRALAQTGSVTLDNDTFVAPTCDLTSPVVTVPAAIADTTPSADVTSVPGLGDSLLNDTTLPRTGRSNTTTLLLAGAAVALGATVVRIARRRPAPLG